MNDFELDSDLNVLYFFWWYVAQGRWVELPRRVKAKLKNSSFVEYKKNETVRLSDKAKEALHRISIYKI